MLELTDKTIRYCKIAGDLITIQDGYAYSNAATFVSRYPIKCYSDRLFTVTKADLLKVPPGTYEILFQPDQIWLAPPNPNDDTLPFYKLDLCKSLDFSIVEGTFNDHFAPTVECKPAGIGAQLQQVGFTVSVNPDYSALKIASGGVEFLMLNANR